VKTALAARPPLTDPFGRAIDYLRVSVTDHCNLRCVYCLPAFYAAKGLRSETLSDDELVALLEGFAALGFSKFRLTGGEPLTRPNLPALVSRIKAIPGVRDLSLSTNGVLLAPLLPELVKAGLDRVNISLDSLRTDRFAKITRRAGTHEAVLAGIDGALAWGLSPVKVNVVVARGMNEDEIPDFVRLTEEKAVHVRFIELMPMGETGFFTKERWVPLEEMKRRAGALEPVGAGGAPRGHGPAAYFRRPGAPGTVGFIHALSCSFCGSCNRVRLSARGMLVPCLDGEDGTDLKDPLRSGADPREIQDLIRGVVARKPERHFMQERAAAHGDYAAAPAARPRFMCQIGG
jgi:cyclic pyranopterin phosphate synthase